MTKQISPITMLLSKCNSFSNKTIRKTQIPIIRNSASPSLFIMTILIAFFVSSQPLMAKSKSTNRITKVQRFDNCVLEGGFSKENSDGSTQCCIGRWCTVCKGSQCTVRKAGPSDFIALLQEIDKGFTKPSAVMAPKPLSTSPKPPIIKPIIMPNSNTGVMAPKGVIHRKDFSSKKSFRSAMTNSVQRNTGGPVAPSNAKCKKAKGGLYKCKWGGKKYYCNSEKKNCTVVLKKTSK